MNMTSLPFDGDQLGAIRLPPLSAGGIRALNGIYYGMCAFHLAEWGNHILDEIQFLLRKKWRTPVKWPYIYSRYFGLAVQICNIFFAHFVQANVRVSTENCWGWLLFQLFAGQTLWASLEYTLFTRLKALYGDSSWEIYLLRSIIAIEKIVNIVIGGISIPKTTMTESCITTNTPVGVAATQGFTIGVLLFIWFLTYRKQPRTRMSASLISLIFKDASYAICAVFVMLLAITFNANSSSKRLLPSWWNSTFFYQCSFPIIVAILTSANCRMVKNLEGFVDTSSDEQAESYGSSVELTSFTALDDEGCHASA